MKRFWEGDENTTDLGKRFRSGGESIGSLLGGRYGQFGSTVGGLIGRGLGAGFSRITGNGDYVVHNSPISATACIPCVAILSSPIS